MRNVSATNYLWMACPVWYWCNTEDTKYGKQCTMHVNLPKWVQHNENMDSFCSIPLWMEEQCWSCGERKFGDNTDPSHSCMFSIVQKSFLKTVLWFLARKFSFVWNTYWCFSANVTLDISIVLQSNQNLIFLFSDKTFMW